MGKRNRKPPQLRHRTSLERPALRMVVASTPRLGVPDTMALRMDRELAMLRTALLYADEIQLLSPVAELLTNVQAFDGLTGQQIMSRIGGLSFEDARKWGVKTESPEDWKVQSSFIRDPSALDRWAVEVERQAVQLDNASQDEVHKVLDQMRRSVEPEQLRRMGLAVQEMLRQQAEESHYAELRPFLRNGRIRPISADTQDEGSEVFQRLSDLLGVAASDPRRYLLTDEFTAAHIHSMIGSGALKVPDRAMGNAREARLHHGLAEAMPTLPNAPLDVIWQVREELNDPLARYRSDVAGLASAIGTSAYDQAMSAEVEHLWLTTVHPAIADIRSALRASSAIKNIAAKAGVTASAPTGAGLIAHTWFGWIPDPAALVTGAGASILCALADEARNQLTERRKIRRLPFYFLHEADRQIAKR